MQTVKVKTVVNYAGHNVTSAGVVNVTFNARYGELANVLLLTQFLETDITIYVRLEEKPVCLGIFSINNIQIKRDGNAVIKISSVNTAVDLNNIGLLADHFGQDFQMLAKGNVDEEE